MGDSPRKTAAIRQLLDEADRPYASSSPVSDTPETDAEAKSSHAEKDGFVVRATFARKLERERNEARSLLRRIARKGAFMDMEGQRLVVSDWLARRHIPAENTPVHPPQVGRDASSDHDSHDETTYQETL